jgi:hypothetical protein
VVDRARELRVVGELGGKIVDDQIERAVRNPLPLVAAAVPLQGAAAARAVDHLVDQCGLADARRTGHEHEAASRFRIGDRRLDARELGGAADERQRAPHRARVRQMAGQPERDLVRGRPAHRVGIEHLRDQVVEILGTLGVDRACARHREAPALARQHVDGATERRRAGDQLEREHAERVDVHRRADDQAFEVLGGQVRDGADDPGLARQLVLGAAALEREPEVEQLDATAGKHDRVRRLDVAVDHAARVEERDALGELREHEANPAEVDDRHGATRRGHRGHRQLGVGLLDRQRGGGRVVGDHGREHLAVALDPATWIDPGQVLHREVTRAIVGDELVELDEVGMAERRDRSKLALQPQRRVGVRDAAELDRDVHVAAQVAAEVDHAHAAAAELANDMIAVADVLPESTLGRNHAAPRYHDAAAAS